MKKIALALLIVVAMSGCAIVPYGYGGPPVYVGVHGGGYYGHGGWRY